MERTNERMNDTHLPFNSLFHSYVVYVYLCSSSQIYIYILFIYIYCMLRTAAYIASFCFVFRSMFRLMILFAFCILFYSYVVCYVTFLPPFFLFKFPWILGRLLWVFVVFFLMERMNEPMNDTLLSPSFCRFFPARASTLPRPPLGWTSPGLPAAPTPPLPPRPWAEASRRGRTRSTWAAFRRRGSSGAGNTSVGLTGPTTTSCTTTPNRYD